MSKNSAARSTGTAGANGPEMLALLDPRIERVAHLGAARIGQDRAIAKGPRPHLEAALEPADDPALPRDRRPRGE